MEAEFAPKEQRAEDSVQKRHIDFPAAIAEHKVSYQPEPVETEEKLVISAKLPARPIPLLFLRVHLS